MSKTPKLPNAGSPGPILPEGVPADNASFSAKTTTGGSGYRAPDMATPQFENEDLTSRASLRRVERREIEIIEEDDDDEDDEDDERELVGPPPGIANMTIILAIGALLAALAAIVLTNGAEPTPLCSTQPIWNQYNCRAG